MEQKPCHKFIIIGPLKNTGIHRQKATKTQLDKVAIASAGRAAGAVAPLGWNRGVKEMQEAGSRATLGELHKIFADGTNGPETRMGAFDAETKLEAEIAQKIQTLVMRENPNETQIKAIMETAKTLLDREIVKMNYGI